MFHVEQKGNKNMWYGIYAIYDRLAEQFSNPFVLDMRTAARTFKFMTKERAEADCEDKEVRYLGRYNSETGEIISEEQLKVWDMGNEKEKLK